MTDVVMQIVQVDHDMSYEQSSLICCMQASQTQLVRREPALFETPTSFNDADHWLPLCRWALTCDHAVVHNGGWAQGW